MTNAQIMMEYKIMHNISLDSPLRTYGEWLKYGYRVRKGEKSLHKVVLHKHRAAKPIKNDEDETVEVKPSRFVTKICYLFAENQVEKI